MLLQGENGSILLPPPTLSWIRRLLDMSPMFLPMTFIITPIGSLTLQLVIPLIKIVLKIKHNRATWCVYSVITSLGCYKAELRMHNDYLHQREWNREIDINKMAISLTGIYPIRARFLSTGAKKVSMLREVNAFLLERGSLSSLPFAIDVPR